MNAASDGERVTSADRIQTYEGKGEGMRGEGGKKMEGAEGKGKGKRGEGRRTGGERSFR